MTAAAAGPAVERLGILVVYYLKDDADLPLLELHLDRVSRHTGGPYTVYGVANRVSDAARSLLESRAHVRLCEVAPTELRGSREHGYYLDALVDAALADDVTHLCTLDVDSFPIRDDWVARLAAAAPEASGLAGILRVENGDSWLPHPSCVFAERGFFVRFAPSFSPDSDGTPEFRRFLRSTGQRADTGIRLAYALWSAGLAWGRLLRTNAVDPHPVMAGIYDDLVFHLGGVGRGKLFRADLAGSRIHRLTSPLARLPLPAGPLDRAKQAVLRRARGPSEAAMAERNRDAYAFLRGSLLSDSDGLIAFLRGEAPEAPPP